MKRLKCIVVSVVALGCAGCGPTFPKMDVSRSIQISSSAFGPRYSQDGAPIDASDMADKLEKEPEAESAVSRSRTLGVVSTIFAIAGGALIGWPLGQWEGGERKPLWALAGAGAGAVAVAIPLELWGKSSMDSAAEAHNKLLARAKPSPPPAPAWKPGQPAQASLPPPPPPDAFGFVFGAPPADVAAACQKAGHPWTEEQNGGRCGGVPSLDIPGASATLQFVDGGLSSVEIVIQPPDDPSDWASTFIKTESTLTRLYGKPAQRSFALPDECKPPEQFLACVKEGKVKGNASWTGSAERAVTLSIVGSPPPSTIHAQITRLQAKP